MKPSQRKFSRRGQRGQAMVEYSMINCVLVVALVLGVSVKMFPPTTNGGPNNNIIDLFLTAYQTYYDSFYFVLNSPFP